MAGGRGRSPAPAHVEGVLARSDAEEVAIAFLNALRLKSPITEQHCTRVATYAAATAVALGLTGAGVCHVERCGLLHDVGKMGIKEDILEKPGPLSPSEWSQIRLHPSMGVRVLEPFRSLEAILPAVAMHHERFDGGGYPAGVSGFDIPVEARIVNICDAYDTMTSDRPYRQSLEPDDAIHRLRAEAGTQFDPHLVNVFAAYVIPAITGGVMRSGEQKRASS